MKVLLQNVRLAFPNLFTPITVNGEGEPAYSASFILTPGSQASIDGGATWGDAVELLNRAIDKVGTDKWAAKTPAILKQMRAQDKACLHDGDLKAQYEGFEGTYYVSARSKQSQRPRVIDRDKSELSIADGRPYAGCYVNTRIELWAQDNNYGKRVNAQVRVVQFNRDGDAFGGGAPVSDEEVDAMPDLDVPGTAADLV